MAALGNADALSRLPLPTYEGSRISIRSIICNVKQIESFASDQLQNMTMYLTGHSSQQSVGLHIKELTKSSTQRAAAISHQASGTVSGGRLFVMRKESNHSTKATENNTQQTYGNS